MALVPWRERRVEQRRSWCGRGVAGRGCGPVEGHPPGRGSVALGSTEAYAKKGNPAEEEMARAGEAEALSANIDGEGRGRWTRGAWIGSGENGGGG